MVWGLFFTDCPPSTAGLPWSWRCLSRLIGWQKAGFRHVQCVGQGKDGHLIAIDPLLFGMDVRVVDQGYVEQLTQLSTVVVHAEERRASPLPIIGLSCVTVAASLIGVKVAPWTTTYGLYKKITKKG